jgi:hypothetical protein
MLYLAGASLVYAWTAIGLARDHVPLSTRDAIGGALACMVVAALWPPVFAWRLLLLGRFIGMSVCRISPDPTYQSCREL